MILLVSWADFGREMQNLAEAFRKYTDYDALHVNAIDLAPMHYDADIRLNSIRTIVDKQNLQDRVRDANFFILSGYLPNSPEMKRILSFIGLEGKLKPNNTIIRTGGATVENNIEKFLVEWIKHGWIYTGGYHVFSISSKIGFVAFTRNICPIDKLPEPNPPKDKLRLCFTSSLKIKGIKPFERVATKLLNEFGGDVFEFVTLTDKPWAEAVNVKKSSNATFDQFWRSCYATNAIESMYMQHAVLSRTDLFTQMLFPDLPVINVRNEEELQKELKHLIDNLEEVERAGRKGREFIERYHHPKVVIKSWEKLIGFVNERRR